MQAIRKNETGRTWDYLWNKAKWLFYIKLKFCGIEVDSITNIEECNSENWQLVQESPTKFESEENTVDIICGINKTYLSI